MAAGLNLPPPSAADPSSDAPSASSAPSAPRPQATVEDVDESTVASTSKQPRFTTGGIIYPPPDIRYIVDKTAALIAKRGPAFEERIKGDERANTKFAFLNGGDPFNAYYKAKIEAIRDGTGPLAGATTPGGGDAAAGSAGGAETGGSRGTPTIDGPGAGQMMRVNGEDAMDEERNRQEDANSTEPPPHLFSVDLPNISAVDLDVIKLTALFVARKGSAFSRELLEKERASNQFQFMRPQHSLFGLYSRMVEQYRTVLYPPSDLMDNLRISAGDSKEKLGMGAGGARQHVLRQAKQRADWEKWLDQKRKEGADREEEEKAAFAEIDWQDFVVAATVEITETDQHIDLPAPMSLREVENMTMAQKRMAAMIEEEEGAGVDEAIDAVSRVDLPGSGAAQVKERPPTHKGGGGGDDDDAAMEMDSDEEAAAAPAATQPRAGSSAPSSAPAAAMKIRKDYVPKTLAERQREAAQQKGATTKCPVCGETVQTSEMAEHVRIELLNPQYRQQRADIEARRAQQAELATGADPSRFLKQFAGARTDIFGLQGQEMSAAKREEEERRRAKEREKVIWDGHAASRGRTRDDYNRPEMVENNMRDIQGRFKAPDTESIGPQIGAAYPQQPDANADAAASAAGIKRPGEEMDPAGQPPTQRPAYEHSAPPTGPQAQHQQHHQMYYNGGGGAGNQWGAPTHAQPPPYAVPPQYAEQHQQQGAPPPPQAPPPSSISITLQLPDEQSTRYADLPPHATVASIRDRVHAERFPTTGASRIKLKHVRTGKMLNLKMTLASAGLQADGDVVEVSVK